MFYDVNSDYNNVDLLIWIDVLLVFACNLNSKAASHILQSHAVTQKTSQIITIRPLYAGHTAFIWLNVQAL